MTFAFETLSLFHKIKKKNKSSHAASFHWTWKWFKNVYASISSFFMLLLIDLKMATQAVLHRHTEGQLSVNSLIDQHTW